MKDSMTRKDSFYMCCISQCALYRNRLKEVYGQSPMKAKRLLEYPVVPKSAPYLNFVATLSTAIAEGRNSRAEALSESLPGDKDPADKDIKSCCEDMNVLEKWLLSFILDSPHRAYHGVLAVNEDTYKRLQDIIRTLAEYLPTLLKEDKRGTYVRQVKVRVIRPPGREQYFEASYLARLERMRYQPPRPEATPLPRDRCFRAVLQYLLTATGGQSSLALRLQDRPTSLPSGSIRASHHVKRSLQVMRTYPVELSRCPSSLVEAQHKLAESL
jgi:hypothetical protein